MCYGGPALLETQSCSTEVLDAPCADQATCRADPTAWAELTSGDGSSTLCTGTALCSSGGAGVGESICNQVYGSGDIEWNHPCGAGSNGGSVDITCLRALVEGSALAGGYQLSASGASAWLYGTGIAAASSANTNYQCWACLLYTSPSPRDS